VSPSSYVFMQLLCGLFFSSTGCFRSAFGSDQKVVGEFEKGKLCIYTDQVKLIELDRVFFASGKII
jgi:hypothetical protein